jgi:Tfp pilus assembly protein PilN
MMPRMVIDYQHTRNHRLGWFLLVLGALLCLGAMLSKERLEQEVGVVDAHLHGGSKATDAPAAATARGRTVEMEISEAEEVARQLATPWQKLFQSLERASSEEVALLSVQPDAQRGSVSIVGEAKEYGDVLTFARRLNQQAPLGDAHLVGTEIREADPQRPMVFTIAARWRISQ